MKAHCYKKIYYTTVTSLWEVVSSLFGYTLETSQKLHFYLNSHLQAIALDNLNGQCTSGHSCKKSSQLILQAIIAATRCPITDIAVKYLGIVD